MGFRRVSRVLLVARSRRTLPTLTLPVFFLQALACSAEGVRRVTLKPLTLGKT